MPGPGDLLVIGYGNPGRLDDGLGPALAERLAALDLPDVNVETTCQLNVEDAAAAADHDRVIFVDASLRAAPPFTLRPVVPDTGTPEFTTHSLKPEQVIGLAYRVFGARTRAFLLEIRGSEFDDFGERLSPDASANLEAALTFLAGALRPGGSLDPAMQPMRSGS